MSEIPKLTAEPGMTTNTIILKSVNLDGSEGVKYFIGDDLDSTTILNMLLVPMCNKIEELAKIPEVRSDIAETVEEIISYLRAALIPTADNGLVQ